jgi:glutathione S-transferase
MSATDTAITHSLVMTRRFAAQRELVFTAISQAEHLQHWMCPAGFTVPNATGELRVGGRFRVEMVSPEGEVFTVGGEYLLIDPPKRLIFTWQWEPGHSMAGIETTVSIELTERSGETELTMTHFGLPSEAERNSHEQGWTGAYENLKQWVERLSTR